MTIPIATEAPPRAVVVASWLYIASAVLTVIGVVVALILAPAEITSAVGTAPSQMSGQATGGVDMTALAAAIAIGVLVFASVVGLTLAVLTVVFARKLLRGRNWARIVLTVFAGLGLLGLLGLLSEPPAQAALSILSVALPLGAAILTFLPASVPWFRRRAARL